MQILKVTDEAFRPYGKVITEWHVRRYWLLCCFRGWWFVGEPLNPNV